LRAQCVKTLDRICAVGTNDAKNALDDSLISQRQQLERDGLTRAPKREIVPTAQLGGLKLRAAWADDGVLIGRTHDDGYVYGFVSGVWADSWHAWRLSNALMCQLETAPSAPVHLVLDCPAHATNRSLEKGMISQYFSLLGLVLRAFRTYGAKVTLHIIGDAAGGVHVALASGAQHVIAYEKSADIRILPRVAVEQVREDAARAEAIPSARVWITTGVADEIVAS
jgi:hypothetical protein